MEPEYSTLYSKQSTTKLQPDLHETSPHHSTLICILILLFHSPPYSTEVVDGQAYTPTPPVCLHDMHMDFTFYYCFPIYD
jgi:hypothetical protein